MGERVVLEFQMFFECFNTFHRMARWNALGKHAKPLMHIWVNVTLSNWFAGFTMRDLSSTSIFAAWVLLILPGLICLFNIYQSEAFNVDLFRESIAWLRVFQGLYTDLWDSFFFAPFHGLKAGHLCLNYEVFSIGQTVRSPNNRNSNGRPLLNLHDFVGAPSKSRQRLQLLQVLCAWKAHGCRVHERGIQGAQVLKFSWAFEGVFLPAWKIRQTFDPGEPGYLVFHDVFFDVA